MKILGTRTIGFTEFYLSNVEDKFYTRDIFGNDYKGMKICVES